MPRLQWLKRTVQGAFEALWVQGFRMAGSGRQRPTVWSSPGGQRILAVVPHPDDEVVGCCGALLAHRNAGDAVSVCCVTDGGRSRALGLPPPEMARVRRTESERAAAALDVELEWLGFPEGAWRFDELCERLAASLRAGRPEIVYAPSRVDFHPEHVRVAEALAQALASLQADAEPAAVTPEVRICASQVPLTSVLTNLIAPVSLDEPAMNEALGAYRSQLGSIERSWRHRRYVGAFHGLRAAEEFWSMDARAYRALHSDGSACDGSADDASLAFRSLRYVAWSDPLAYLKGRAERRRLRRLIEKTEARGA
ncbi:MAG: PIG-L family deacetylase [Acidobacteriota bacterium]